MSSNLFAQFRRLAPAQPLLVGVVISASATEALVELPGGARIAVRNAGASAGDSVFVRAGAVEGPAPALGAGTIEV